MSSDAFYQYLNGLVSAAKIAEATPAKQAKGGAAPVGGDAASGDPAASTDENGNLSARTLKRRPSQLGLVDGWGVYQRDEDATNPLFNDAHSHGRVTKSLHIGIGKKKNKEHEKDMAVQVARMIITDVRGSRLSHPVRFGCPRCCHNRGTLCLWAVLKMHCKICATMFSFGSLPAPTRLSPPPISSICFLVSLPHISNPHHLSAPSPAPFRSTAR